uniref:tubulin epsilon and delta complex protein 1 isoform X2 n=1 Tax=Jaculus jaculus TaxID=51337 RepID=UPI001E1B38B7|nr:tubulin epsilon and delta complex protein 1 isoform X2 [Jaculus jaculus]
MGRRRRREDRAAGALPEAIAALSRSLPAGPSPEIFRRAKFDRPEAAPALWQLLFRVLSPLATDKTGATLVPEFQVRLVKSVLRSQGYPRSVLAQRSEGNSQSSRELLLALSWLLARGPLLEQLLAQSRVQLGDQVSLFESVVLARPGPPASCMEIEGPVDLHQVQWLMGKLRIRWRQLLSSQQEHCSLLSKLLQALECENVRLEAALEWRRCELVFWQWMDTVLGACTPGAPAVPSQPLTLPVIPERGLGELELVAWELQALQEELQEAAEPRRAAWEAQVSSLGRGPEWITARKTLQETVEQELTALQRSWEQSGGPPQLQRPHRLVRSKDGTPGPQDLQAAEMIRMLRTQEASLDGSLRQLQDQCQQELARLAGTLPGLIWILAPGH